MKSIEERVYELLKELWPDPVVACDIERKVRQNRPAVAAVLLRLYEKKLITACGGGFICTEPQPRTIDAKWEG